jgi:hypothetical protein
MTPNQYIITEEKLQKYEGLGHSELLYEIRSRPYQSERDKVLDEVWKRWSEHDYTKSLWDILQELRQKAGE